MKLFILFLLLCNSTIAQKIERFYNYKWEPSDVSAARFYSVIKKKDAVWERNDYYIRERRLQMHGYFLDSATKLPHGEFYYYHPNGKLSSTGSYTNGKKDGVWISYHANEMMEDSSVYLNGREVGTSFRWHENGYLADSVIYNLDGSGLLVSWFDNGNASVAGVYSAGRSKHGKWKYYHRNGVLANEEVYSNGTLTSRQYYSEEGGVLTDTANTDRPAEFPGGKKAWGKHIQKNIYFPSQYKITNADEAIVVVEALIDEEGNVSAEVIVPFHKDFDDIALKAVKKSPKWKPAFQNGRKVKYRVRQSVIFQQTEF